MNGYDAQEAIDNPPRGDATVLVLDYADGLAKAFRQGQEQAPAAAPVIDLERIVPPEWLSEQIGGQFDELTSGQAFRAGFNQCRERALLLIEQSHGLALIDASPKRGSDAQSWKLLIHGDIIRRGDQILNDDCATWGELVGWEVGTAYNPAFHVPMRRLQATSAGVKQ